MYQRLSVLLLALLLIAGGVAAAQDAGEWSPVISSRMPIISIVTDDGGSHFATAWVREDKLRGKIDYVGATVSVSNCEVDEIHLNARAQVKVRGNWTLDYPKKSIRIKFEEKQGMLGLNEGRAYKNWVLLAEWKDLSLLNSPVALFLAQNILGTEGYYVTDYRFVQLYINGEYWGVYLLTEQQEVNPGRVDIAEPEKGSSIRETGYFFEYDAYFTEEAALPQSDPTFEVFHQGSTAEQQGYTVKSDIYSSRQTAFLRSCVRLIYRICHQAITENRHYAFNDNYTEIVPVEGASVQETIGRVVDLPSLVDTYILNEIACNPDLNWSSFYLSLDMSEEGSKRLTFHAPWDFDSAFGIRTGYESSRQMYASPAGNPWLSLFAGEEWFQEMVRARWAELKAQGIVERTFALIDAFQAAYAPYFDQNYTRWPSRIIEGNHELTDELNSFQTQQEAADRLRRWLRERFDYLDSQWQP